MNPVENLAIGLLSGAALGVIAGYIMGWFAGVGTERKRIREAFTELLRR